MPLTLSALSKKHPTVQSLPDAVWINRLQPLLETGAESPLGV